MVMPHGEVFIELGFVACDVCDAVAYFTFWAETSLVGL